MTTVHGLLDLDEWHDMDEVSLVPGESPVTPIDNSTPLPCKRKVVHAEPAPKRQLFEDNKIPPETTSTPKAIIAQVTELRLPDPCPLPNNFTRKTNEACERGELTGTLKLSLLREASAFYYGLCPKPTPTEYVTMAKTLCNKFPQLKDKRPINGEYWVSSCMCHFALVQ